jgi:hypothetical protein
MFSSENVLTEPVNEASLASSETRASSDRLREIAREHQVCYEVWPEWYIKDGIKIKIGFELQLCGINHPDSEGNARHPVPGCPICLRTYNELREIADWVLPVDERPSRYEIHAFDNALHIASAKRFRRREVVVTIVIRHRSDFNRPVDDCENRCLKEMRQRLLQLGIHEDVWREAKGLQK